MTKREKLMRGVNQMALAFPFIFGGPTLFYFKGAKAMQHNEPWWLLLSVAIMITAVFFVVRGLRIIMAAFFED